MPKGYSKERLRGNNGLPFLFDDADDKEEA